LHLIDPRSISPGSKMPSYAHLFAGDSTRGDDLVTYLASLGAGRAEERLATIRSYTPSSTALDAGDAARGAALFARSCAPCHGASATGDGPAGWAFNAEMMDLRKRELWLAPVAGGTDDQRVGLARLIKFGWPGRSMPGHEYFSDEEVADLVAHVQSLRPGAP
jgi:cytochrome c oxidase cbb3-type subunit 2